MFADKIIEEFKTTVLAMIIHETKHYVHTTLETDANTWLFEHGSHYIVYGLDYYNDGLGFDFSQTRQPTVTDDSLLTFFMKGYWYKTGAPSEEEIEEIVPIKHTKFEVGQEGVQDLMLHVSEGVVGSLLNAMVQFDGGFEVGTYF